MASRRATSSPQADEVPVASTARPLSIEYVSLKGLMPYARNARTHSRAQLQKLKSSLAHFGWATPMGQADGELIYGHGRLEAALELAEEGVEIPGNPDPQQGPVVDLSHLSPADRRAYVLADNRLALDAGWDNDLLRLEIESLKSEGFDLALTGFEMPEMTVLFAENNPGPELTDDEPPADFKSYDESIETEHQCPKCGYQWSGGKVTRSKPAAEE